MSALSKLKVAVNVAFAAADVFYDTAAAYTNAGNTAAARVAYASARAAEAVHYKAVDACAAARSGACS